MSASLVSNTVFSSMAGVATALGGFASMVIVARILGVEGTGVVSYALWIVLLSVTIADLGLHATLTRYLPELTARGRRDEAESLAAFLLRPAALASFAMAAALLAVASWIALAQGGGGWTRDPVIRLLMAAVFLAQSAANFATGYLRGMQAFGLVARLSLFGLALQLAAVAAGGWMAGHVGAFAGYLAGSVLQAAMAFGVARKARGAPPDELVRRVRRFAGYAWIGSIASAIVWTRVEVFFLEHFLGPAAVGLYAAALTFANLAVQGPMLLTGALLPFFSEGFGRADDAGSRARVEAVFASATRIVALLAFPASLCLAAVTPVLLPAIYGPAFAQAATATSIVVVAAGVGAAGAVGSHLIYAADRSEVAFFVNVAGAALAVLAGLVVVPRYGVEGAAWARAAVHTTLVAAGFAFIVRRLGFPLPVGGLPRILAAAATAAGTAALALRMIPGPAALPLALLGAAAAYPLAVRAFGALQPIDVRHLRAFLARLPAPAARAATAVLAWLAPGAGDSRH